jgi:hypothetical protein
VTISLYSVAAGDWKKALADWFASNWIVSGTVVAALAIAAPLIGELKNDEPIVNFRLFRNLRLRIPVEQQAVSEP